MKRVHLNDLSRLDLNKIYIYEEKGKIYKYMFKYNWHMFSSINHTFDVYYKSEISETVFELALRDKTVYEFDTHEVFLKWLSETQEEKIWTGNSEYRILCKKYKKEKEKHGFRKRKKSST